MLMTSSKAKYSSTRLATFSLELFQWLQLELRWPRALYDVHEKLITSICLILLAFGSCPYDADLISLQCTSVKNPIEDDISRFCCRFWNSTNLVVVAVLPWLGLPFKATRETPPHHTPNFFSSSANPGIRRYQSLISISPPHSISKGLKSARAMTWSQLSWDPATSNQPNGKTQSSSQPFEFIQAT